MGNLKTKSKAKITRYIPILLILLSITIMIGSTFAYFSDRVDEDTSLTFSKVELSSDTTVGIDGKIGDALPGTPIIESPISFSKSVKSEAMYVRAKISFSLPEELKNDDEMAILLSVIKNSTDFGVTTEIQNGAVWSEKQGDYFYLLDSSANENLKLVDTEDTYLLSNSIVVPRGLEQLDEKYQYMKSFNYHIAFEAIQADNVSPLLEDTKTVFNSVFPTTQSEVGALVVVIMDEDFNITERKVLPSAQKIEEPTLDLSIDENGTTINMVEGWYKDKYFINKFDFNSNVEESVTLYPNVVEISNGLAFTPITEQAVSNAPNFAANAAFDFTESREGERIIGYSVSKGTCSDSLVVIPEFYNGLPVMQIANSAFSSYNKMTDVVVSNQITIIGDNAFAYTKLTEFEIPSSVTTIGYNPFRGLLNLDLTVNKLNNNFQMEGNCLIENSSRRLITGFNDSVIPEDVKIVGDYAFYYCDGLECEVILNDCEQVGIYAFDNCVKITKLVVGDNCETIGDYAFRNCAALAEVVTGENLTSIGTYAFENCSVLTTVEIKDKLEVVSSYAFNKCSALTGIHLPDSLITIGSNAFSQCTPFTEVTIPINVTTLGDSAFYNCINLSKVNFLATEVKETNRSTPFGSCGTNVGGFKVDIAANVTKIPKYLFQGTKATTVTFEEGSVCNYIGDYAFSGCSSMVVCNIPNGVLNIGESAFNGCSNFKLDKLPDALLNLGANAFRNCSKALFTTLPQGLTVIGDYAFNNCTNAVISATLNQLKTIGSYAFVGSGIKSLEAPNLIEIKESAFAGCRQLKMSELSESVQIIGQCAFQYCENVTFSKLPSSLTSLGGSAFYSCHKITISNIPGTIGRINSSTFAYCSSIKNAIIGEGITYMEDYAFNECTSLESITIPDGLTYLNRNVFANARKLKQININSTLSNVSTNYGAFTNAGIDGDGIDVFIGENVTKIPEYLFDSKPKVKSIKFLGDKVTSIGKYAFYNLDITSLEMSGTDITLGEKSIANCFYLTDLVCNATLIPYKGSSGYEQVFANAGSEGDGIDVVIGENATEISDRLFYGANVISVEFENADNITRIGDYAFSGCTKLNIQIPKNVTSIGQSAFYNCQSLTEVLLPKGLTYIGSSAFSNCLNLTKIDLQSNQLGNFTSSSYIFSLAGTEGTGIEVYISKDVERIPNYFLCPSYDSDYNKPKSQPNVVSIIFEENSKCTQIGEYAFIGCSYLTRIDLNCKITNANTSYRGFVKTGNLGEGITLNVAPYITEIPDNLFYSANVKEVVFKEGSQCTTIGVSAFYSNYNLVSVNFPSSLRTIKSSAFNNSGIVNVDLPEGVTTIEQGAFYDSDDIEKLTLPSSITYIGARAFYGAAALKEFNYDIPSLDDFNEDSDAFGYSGFKGEGFTVNIGANVKRIPAYFLYQSYGLNSVSCPYVHTINFAEGSICEEIGRFAFEQCEYLTTITLPSSLKTIGSCAFKNCIKLSNITLNSIALDLEEDETIFNSAGTESEGTQVIIGSDVEKIPDYIFDSLNVVEVIFVATSSLKEIGVAAFRDNENLTEVNIPNTVTKIGAYAFQNCSSLTSIDLPDNLESISSYLLSGCKLIENVELPSSVTSIGSYAFNNTNIKQIILPNNLTSIPNGVFNNCKNLESVEIPETITSIGDSAFRFCEKLTGFDLPGCIRSIGSYAFEGCKGLTELTLQENLKDIGIDAFRACGNISKIYFNATRMNDLSSDAHAFWGAGDSTDHGISVIIANTVTRIPGYIFEPYYGNSSIAEIIFEEESICKTIGPHAFQSAIIQTIIIPSSIIEIGDSAFNWCQRMVEVINLSSLKFDKGSLDHGAIVNKCFGVVTSLEASKIETDENGFIWYDGGSSNTCLVGYEGQEKDIVLPTNYKGNNYIVCYYAFYNNKNIETLTISQGVTTIGYYAFAGCDNLKSVYISNTVTDIGQASFYGCGNLTSITFQENSTCKRIYTEAFAYCSSLPLFTIPASMTRIDDNAFQYCTNLLEVVNHSSMSISAGSSSNGYVAYYAIRVMDEYESKYETTENGFIFYNGGEGNITLIAYEGTDTELVLPDNYNGMPYQIHSHFGMRLNGVESIVIPGSVESITSNAFANSSIKYVTIQEGVFSIGSSAFQNCKDLLRVDIPSSVSSIGYSAFSGCSSLTKIIIPENLSSIPSDAFSGCSAVTEIYYNARYIRDFSYGQYNYSVFLGCGDESNGIALTIGPKVQRVPAYLFASHFFSYTVYREYCINVTSVTFECGSELTSIGAYAFHGFVNLTEINYNVPSLSLGSSSYIFEHAGVDGDGITLRVGKEVQMIPQYMFESRYAGHRPNISNVIFEEDSECLEIGAYAFNNHSQLKSINLPNTITSIGERAFSGCSNADISIPTSLTSIPSYAFYNCSAMTQIYIGENVTSIGTYAFYGCSNVNEIIYKATNLSDYSKDNYIFYNVGHEGEGIALTIGANVTRIPAYIFHPYYPQYPGTTYTTNAPKITSVAFEENSQCTSIGQYAFYNCIDVGNITIPSSVTSVEQYAFYNCLNLACAIPQTITSIGQYAFYKCGYLTSLTIHSGVSIGSSAFTNSGLTDVYFNIANMSDSGSYLGGAGRDNAKVTLTIDASVTRIPKSFFSSFKVTHVIFEEGSLCTEIAERAFYNTYKLQEIEIPENVTTIGQYAFYNTRDLTKLYFNASVSDFGSKNNIFYQSGIDGEGINVVFGPKVTRIPSYFFYPAENSSSYNYSPKVCSIDIGESVTNIGSYAFAFTFGLKQVRFNAKNMPDINNFNYTYNLTCDNDGIDIIIGKDVETVPGSIFAGIASKAKSIIFEEDSKCTRIGRSAFSHCTNVETVVLSDSITFIGDSAFYECGAKSVVLSKELLTIDSAAFYNCYNLESIEFPDKLTTIGSSAFCNSYKLDRIDLPSSVTSIGAQAFYNSGAKFITIPEGLTTLSSNVFGYCQDVQEVRFNSINMSNLKLDYNKTTILDNFGVNADYTKLIIGNKVTRIPQYLFSGTYINEVEFESTSICSEIASYAFINCSELEVVNLPESISSIGVTSFASCIKLQSITLNNNITTIGDRAFYSCIGLTEINFNNSNIGDLLADKSLFAGAGLNSEGVMVNIGANITHIPSYLFYSSNITSIRFENGSQCESIGDYAFANSTNLTNLALPESLTSIGIGAFENCTGLGKQITIPANVTNIGDNAFKGCNNILEVVNTSALNIEIGKTTNGYVAYYALRVIFQADNSYIEIGNDGYVFYVAEDKVYLIEYRGDDTKLSLPTNYNGQNYVIYNNAFSDNANIVEVTIPSSVTEIGNEAFKGCSNLQKVTFEANSSCQKFGKDAFRDCVSLGGVIIPENVQVLREGVFTGCESLETITFADADNCYEIGAYAFLDCSSLTTITLPNITTLSNGIFANCVNLQEFAIPSSVTSIGDGAFANCNKLTTLQLPNSLTRLGNYTFYNCYNLTSINFSDSLTYIGINAFYNCYGLTSIYIPAGVEEVGKQAFYGCYNVTVINFNAKNMKNLTYSENAVFTGIGDADKGLTVNFGSDVERIPSYLFNNNDVINNVTFSENNNCKVIGEYAFYGTDKLLSIVLPEGLITLEYEAFAQSAITNFKFSSTVKTIGDFVFYRCEFTSIEIGKGVETIGKRAFYYCTKLTTITFEEGSNCKTLLTYAFEHCENLKSITIPKSVETIEDYAISECYQLSKVTFEKDSRCTNFGDYVFYNSRVKEVIFEENSALESLGRCAFYYCSSLEKIVLPENLKIIEAYAFRYCSGLTSIKLPESLTTIEYNAFDYCSKLASIVIPSNVTSIGSSAFYSCNNLDIVYNLSSLDIVKGSTSNGYVAYYASQVLNTVGDDSGNQGGNGDNETIVTINGYQFFDDGANNVYLIGYTGNETNLTLPNDYNGSGYYIKSGAFANSNIESITIPAGVKSIASGAFSGCNNLALINYNVTNMTNSSSYSILNGKAGFVVRIGANVESLPNSFLRETSVGRVEFAQGSQCTSIGEYAFYYCRSLTSITLPNNLSSLGTYACYGCESLTEIKYNATNLSDFTSSSNVFSYLGQGEEGVSVIIGANVTRIPSYLFYPSYYNNDLPISSVTFEEGSQCTSIGSYAFYRCPKITTLILPESLQSIGSYAFYYLGITSIEIPKNVTSLGSSVFWECSTLTEIKFNATNCTTDNRIFLNTSGVNITIGANVTRIPYGFFWNVDALSVEFEEGSQCTSIGDYAFSSNPNLINIEIPEGVTSIGSQAFYENKKLTEIKYNAISLADFAVNNNLFYNAGINGEGIDVIIGANVERVPAYLFLPYFKDSKALYLPKIKSITFEEGSKCISIGDSAFYGCSYVERLNIPNTVTSIGNNAFYGCTHLETLDFNANIATDYTSSSGVFYMAGDSVFGVDITIGANVTRIPNYLFRLARPSSIEFAEGSQCTYIGDYGFGYCKYLEELEIPEGVTYIGSNTFYESKIKSITIPEGVQTIGAMAFESCYYLEEVRFNAINLNNFVENSRVFNRAGLNSNGIKVIIGARVTKIPAYFFYQYDSMYETAKVKSVEFEGVSQCTLIGAYSFCNATSLIEIEIPVNVTSVGNYAFYNTIGLRKVKLNAINLNNFSSGNNIFYKAGTANRGIDVEIGRLATKIPSYLFYPTDRDSEIPKLRNITFEEDSQCTSIGTYAFYNCDRVTSIEIPRYVTFIGSYAFYNAERLTSIEFNAKAVSDFASNNNIFYNAGKDSSGINVTINSEVERIPAYLFYPCNTIANKPNIKDITFGDDFACTYIGAYAFYNCTNMTKAVIPETVEVLGSYAFGNCKGLTEIVYNAIQLDDFGTNGVFASAGNSGDGLKVTFGAEVKHIPANIFYPTGSTSTIPYLVEVVFEEGSVCESIGAYAFYKAYWLKSFNMPQSVISIGEYAFYGCDELTALNIPNTVTSIGAYAFYGCSKITSITIPKGVTTIGSYAFAGCVKVAEVNFNATALNDLTTTSYVFTNLGKKSNELVLNISANVTKIPAYIFYAGGITNVVFSEGSECTSIGAYAFYNCSKLQSIEIPSSVTSIGTNAFYGCTSLTNIEYNATTVADLVADNNVFYNGGKNGSGIEVTIGANVTKLPNYLFYSSNGYSPNIISVEFEEDSVCTSIGTYTFYNLVNLQTINIPNGVTSIGAYAFYNCSQVAEIDIPNGVTSIGNYTFYNCSKITSITIPKGVTTIGSYAFAGCVKVAEVNFNATALNDLTTTSYVFTNLGKDSEELVLNISANVTKIPAYIFYAGGITNVVFSEGSECTSIGAYAFYNCSKIQGVEIPEKVTSIGTNAFYGCTSLTNIEYNATTVADLVADNNVFYNGGKNGSGIEVTIGANVTKLPNYLFYPSNGYSPNIISVEFEEDSVCTSIGTYTFYNLVNLQTINIPNTVMSIGAYAFYNCSQVAEIDIPNGVTSIGNYTFYNCKKITNITISENITSIGNYAFSDCVSVTKIDYNATALSDFTNKSYVFNNVGKDSEELVLNIGANVTKIPAYIFYAGGISDIVFSEGSQCTSIGTNAFYNCSKIQGVEIPEKVTSIGTYAFYGCTSLTNIEYNATTVADLPSNNYVFYNGGKNGSGIEVTIGANVTKLPNYLFYPYNGYSPNIISVEFEEGSQCTSIGTYAFYSCSKITSVTISESITSIGNYAFANCTGLTEINYKATALGDFTNSSYVFNSAGSKSEELILNISANVIKIPAYIFYAVSITDIVFSEGSQCTSIGTYAFYNATKLQSIEIVETISSIGNYAFYGCSALTSIEYNATTLTDLSSNNYVFYNAGKNGGGIEVTISANVTKLPNYLFYPYNTSTIPNIISVEFEEGSQCTSIGTYAFYSAVNLESITIPSGVTSIGTSAFYNCTSLNSINFNATNLNDLSSNNYVFYNAGKNVESVKVVIGANVTRIPNYLFYPYGSYYPNIVDVEFAEESQCASIGTYAFYNCSKLENINLPQTITSIGTYAFYNCSQLKKVDIHNGITTINSYTFYNCSSLESIKIPVTVTSIGTNAFYGCTALTSIEYNATTLTDLSSNNNVFYNGGKNASGINVTIGGNVTKIPNYLFYPYNGYSPNILSVTFEEGSVCESIGTYAFYGCNSLFAFKVPSSITSIGNYAFQNCTSLLEVINLSTLNIEKGKTTYGYIAYYALKVYSENVESNIITDENGFVFYADGDVINLVKYVGEGTEVVLPNDYNGEQYTLYTRAFYNNAKITSVEFTNGTTSIGAYAFYGCTNLESITFGNVITTIGDYAFYGCTKLAELTIPENITSIGKYSFQNCTYLTKINYNATAANDLTSSNYTFYDAGKNASGITLTIGANVTSLPNYLFYPYSANCPKITSIVFEEGSVCLSIGTYTFYNCKYIPDIIIPSSITSIGDYAFQGCIALIEVINLSELEIVKGETTNGYVAYYALGVYNENIGTKVVTDSDGYSFFDGGEGNTYLLSYTGTATSLTLPSKFNGVSYNIYDYAFYNKTTLTSVTIPEGVTTIGNYAFYGCSKITTINLPESITTIENYAFYSCSRLVNINLPNTVESIGNYAFYGCSKLASINLSNTITSIGTHAFYNCSALTSIDLPDNLETISNYMFYGCSKITEFVLPDSITSIGNYAFYGCTTLASINLHNAITSIGTYVFYNCTSLLTIDLPDNLETITDYMFYGCKFTEFVVPDSITTIGQYAFSNCTALVSVNTGKNVTQIGGYAFNACTLLESVTMGDNVTSIGSYAFNGCTKLVSVDLPDGLKTISSYAFYNCTGLTSIVIPESVTSIGSRAYYGCTSVTEIKFNAIAVGNFSSSNRIFYNVGKNGTGITLTIGAKVTSIPAYIFNPYNSTSYAPKITSVVFEANSECTSVGQNAFGYCSNILSIVLPASITSVGSSAFQSTGSAYVLCVTDTIAGYVKGKGNTNIYVLDDTTDFSAITFTGVTSGDVNGTYNDGTNYYVRTGESGSYVYYKKYTA